MNKKEWINNVNKNKTMRIKTNEWREWLKRKNWINRWIRNNNREEWNRVNKKNWMGKSDKKEYNRMYKTEWKKTDQNNRLERINKWIKTNDKNLNKLNKKRKLQKL